MVAKAWMRVGIAWLLGLAPIAPGATQQCEGIWVAIGTQEHRCLRPGAGERFKDCADCPELVVVPAGTFMMGSPPNEPQREGVREDQVPVTIAKPFGNRGLYGHPQGVRRLRCGHRLRARCGVLFLDRDDVGRAIGPVLVLSWFCAR